MKPEIPRDMNATERVLLIAPHRLSNLIGAIYDCSIDPDRWPETMREICIDLRCMWSTILLIDREVSSVRFVKSWNYDVACFAQDRYRQDVFSMALAGGVTTEPIGEPWAGARHGNEVVASTRFGREVVLPMNSVDSFKTIVFRNVQRIGLFIAVRHESEGLVTDHDLALMRLLAPHVRRAITISDLMDLKALEANALSATLDRLATGVVVVAGENRILHANEAARQMFSDGGPIVSRHGRLAVRDTAADQELTKSIELARRDEATMGATGIGVSIGSAAAEPVLAHVLPLAQGDLRSRFMPQATAAVFITGPQTRFSFDLAVLTHAYGLTPAEVRVLERLSVGATLGEVAETLDISETTVKTHLAHIFSKTGVSRQSDLIALVHRIAPPLR